MDMFWAFSWIWIPIIAILAGAFTEYLKFKEKQRKLGSSTEELEKRFDEQKQALDAAQRRIQNLEAIVTSQVWDVVHDDALPEAERQRALAQARIHLDPAPAEPSDAERAAEIARRIKH